MTSARYIYDGAGNLVGHSDVDPAGMFPTKPHEHPTFTEGCWGCIVALPFPEQVRRVEALRRGECVQCGGQRDARVDDLSGVCDRHRGGVAA